MSNLYSGKNRILDKMNFLTFSTVCLFVKDGFMRQINWLQHKQRAPLIRIFLRPKTIYCFQLSDVVREDKREGSES